MTLTEFLLARIAEDEASAKDCLAHPEAMRAYDREVQDTYRQGWKAERASDLISRWHPARVLAECAAKRRIVEQFQMARFATELDIDEMDDPANTDAEILLTTLVLLALPYADHPDYDETWRLASG